MNDQPPADLLDAAQAASANAYVPYSNFHVGAALRAADGVIYRGANVENGSFGLTRCAEQSAVQALITAGGRNFTELVVFTSASPPASPCGACRQVLAEFARGADVWLVNAEGEVIRTSVQELLPLAFDYTESVA